MLWTLLGIIAVILSLRYPAIAIILIIAFIGYNLLQLISSIRDGTVVSGLIINGTCVVVGGVVLIWMLT